jgi:predicted RNA-binding Zn ribbon-like protein
MGGFVWLGGRPALDLCNTLGSGDDLLTEPADIGRWLAEAGYGPPEREPGSRDLERVRALRGALRDAFVRRDPETVADVVGDWLQETPGRLAVDRTSLRPNFCPEVSTCRCLLVPVLLDALDLARDDIPRVRECAAEKCPYIYLDTSRNGSRRWCSMERCGSRAKAHNYYARRRAAANPGQQPEA